MKKWRRFNGEPILELKKTVEQTIIKEKKAGNKLKVCIGSDSQVHGMNIECATVIVF